MPFVSCAKAPPVKRSEKGYGDENGVKRIYEALRLLNAGKESRENWTPGSAVSKSTHVTLSASLILAVCRTRVTLEPAKMENIDGKLILTAEAVKNKQSG